MKMSHGPRARSRKVMRKRVRERGMPPVNLFLQRFEIGEKAAIVINSAVHSGMPHRRFQGKTGTVVGRRGRMYLVEVRDGGKKKMLIVNPVHLRKVR